MRFYQKNLKMFLGLSATPSRAELSEIDELVDLFGGVLYMPRSLGKRPIIELMNSGVLSKVHFKKISDVPSEAVQKIGDRKVSVERYVNNEIRWKRIVEVLANDVEGQTVVYSYNKEHGQMLCRHLRYLGLNAEYFDGDTNYVNRVGVLERFRTGETNIVVNVNLLLEGVDCPTAKNVLLTYPVRSSIRIRQMIGRVLRGPAVGGTQESFVWGIEGSQSWLESLLYEQEWLMTSWKMEMLS
jgi:superfamily II DNA or RNA helicase